jgi:hypothetical protein
MTAAIASATVTVVQSMTLPRGRGGSARSTRPIGSSGTTSIAAGTTTIASRVTGATKR